MGSKNTLGVWAYALVALMLCTLAVGLGQAEVNQDHYNVLRVVPSASHSAVSAIDTQTYTTTPLDPQKTEGNPKVCVEGTFSVASATASIRCALYFKNADGTYTWLGFADTVQTLTAAAAGTTCESGRFPCLGNISWDTRGAPYYEIRVFTISSGTLTLKPWCYGAESMGRH